MISSKKIRFIILLTVICIVVPLFASEPNEPNEPNKPNKPKELKILVSNNRPADPLLRINYKPPYSASCFAAVFIKGNWGRYDFEGILDTDAAKTMYYLQRDLISRQFVQSVDFGVTIGGYSYFRLYGVGPEEAKDTVEPFIEDITKKSQEKVQEQKESLARYEETLAKAKKDLPEKESQYNKMNDEINLVIEKKYPSSSIEESINLAKESILEMDKTLDKLEIELAGIKEKLKTIEKYRNEQKQRAEIYTKLDGMYVELMIELSGLEAKKEITEKIFSENQNFLYLNSECGKFNQTIDRNQKQIEEITNRLNNPDNTMKPPEIFQNSVTIYPVTFR